MQLFGGPRPSGPLVLFGSEPGGFIQRLVFLGRKSRAVSNLARAFIRGREVRQVLQPSVADGRLNDLPQSHDFMVHGAF